MDKVVFKDLMRGHDLPVVDYTWFRRSAWMQEPEHVVRDVAASIGPHSVVKPARLGSSVGMSLVHDLDALPAALDEAFRYDSKAIVERYVEHARELECGVLGNEDPIVFEPGEVRSSHEFYDYEAKYVAGLATVEPRADVDPDLAARLKELSLAAYRAVDGAGLARIDFLVTPDEAFISEMKTCPFHATSSTEAAEMAACRSTPSRALISLAMERDRDELKRSEVADGGPHRTAGRDLDLGSRTRRWRPGAPFRSGLAGAPAVDPSHNRWHGAWASAPQHRGAPGGPMLRVNGRHLGRRALHPTRDLETAVDSAASPAGGRHAALREAWRACPAVAEARWIREPPGE